MDEQTPPHNTVKAGDQRRPCENEEEAFLHEGIIVPLTLHPCGQLKKEAWQAPDPPHVKLQWVEEVLRHVKVELMQALAPVQSIVQPFPGRLVCSVPMKVAKLQAEEVLHWSLKVNNHINRQDASEVEPQSIAEPFAVPGGQRHSPPPDWHRARGEPASPQR